jgi:hypothetical protein
MSNNTNKIYKNLTEGILDIFIINIKNQTIQDGINSGITPQHDGIIALYASGCAEFVQGCNTPDTYDKLIKRLHTQYNKMYPSNSCDLTSYIHKIASTFLPPDFATSMGIKEAQQMTHQTVLRILKNCLEICSPHIRNIMMGSVDPNGEIYTSLGRSTYLFLDQLQSESVKRLYGGRVARGEQNIDPAILESMKVELRNALMEKVRWKQIAKNLENVIKEKDIEIAQLKISKNITYSPPTTSSQSFPRSNSPQNNIRKPSIIDLSNIQESPEKNNIAFTIKNYENNSDEVASHSISEWEVNKIHQNNISPIHIGDNTIEIKNKRNYADLANELSELNI